MVYGKIVRMSLIYQLVIRIHVCPWDLAVILRGWTVKSVPKFGIFKERTDSAHWARSGQRHRFPAPWIKL